MINQSIIQTKFKKDLKRTINNYFLIFPNPLDWLSALWSPMSVHICYPSTLSECGEQKEREVG